MAKKLDDFLPKHKWLVCVDSDGCAIDSMEVKHRLAFGPIAASEWRITSRKDEFLARWNDINLYSATRGINRFKGLSMIAKEFGWAGWEEIKQWTETSPLLSNEALAKESGDGLKKALKWSLAVNEAIEALPLPKPFDGVETALSRLGSLADIAVVSSANPKAIREEWEAGGLMPYASVVTSQNDGPKAAIIACLLKKGYSPENVLVVGDAPGDMAAARENNVSFYPIIPGKEAKCWQLLVSRAWQEFMDGQLDKSYVDEFCVKLNLLADEL